MRRLAVILAFLVICGGVAEAADVPLPRPRVAPSTVPHSFAAAAGPDFNSAEVTSAPSECRQRLQAIATVVPMPRLIGPGACGGSDMVELRAVLLPTEEAVALNPAPLLRCEMAESLAAFIRDEAVPRLARFGDTLRTVETYDDFECRGRNRAVGGKLSEHAKGNAVDLRALKLADGRALALTDAAAPKELRESIRAAACERFTTVLGPGSDSHHEGHIHLDLLQRAHGYRICQWDVRAPAVVASAATVPLPAPRPRIAHARVKDGHKL